MVAPGKGEVPQSREEEREMHETVMVCPQPPMAKSLDNVQQVFMSTYSVSATECKLSASVQLFSYVNPQKNYELIIQIPYRN